MIRKSQRSLTRLNKYRIATCALAIFTMLPVSAFAQTTPTVPDLQASLISLQAQLAKLRQQQVSNSVPVITNSSLSRALSLGAKGSDVSSLQTYLKSQGYYTYTEITGYFGPATAQAVAAYQRANNLEAVGSVGPRTRALLNASFASSGATSPSASGAVVPTSPSSSGTVATNSTLSRLLSLGSKGSDVSGLQVLLQSKGYYTYPEITGYYGNATAQAVAAYQRANNLEAVGTVGPKTIALLNTLFANTSSPQGQYNDASSEHTNSTGTSGHDGKIVNSTPSSGGISVGGGSTSGGGGGSSGGGGSTTPAPVPAPTLTFAADANSVISGGRVTLTWSSTRATSCMAGGAWSGPQSTDGSQTFTNLTTNQTYTLQCSGTGGAATESVSVVVTGSAPDTASPSTPSGLTGSAISQAQINLTWTASTDNVGVTGYRVFRNGTQVGIPSGTSYSDTGLTAATSYTYTVKAVDAAGNLSAPSNSSIITTQTPVDITPPSVTITGPVSSLTVGTVSAVLAATTNETATCRYSTVSSTVYASMTAFTTTGGTTHSTAVSPLSNGTSYLYYVKCQDTAGNTSNNASVSFSVANPATDTASPSAPIGLSGSAVSSGQINLTWTASTDNVGVTGYKIYRDGVQIGTSLTASFSDTGLAASTVYGYSVAAYDAAGNVSTQSSVSALITSVAISSPVVAVGNRVVITANLNVHSGAGINAASAGSQPVGAAGVVLAGPTIVDGYTWWQVNYDTGVDGWVIGDYLMATTPASSATVGMIMHSSVLAQAGYASFQ